MIFGIFCPCLIEKCYLCDMISIGEMQFGGMLSMALLAFMLMLCVPRRSARHAGFSQARWLMVMGTSLIAIQFMIQHVGGFRERGVSQAVLWNQLLFMPATVLINLALIYVQKQGRVKLQLWLVGGAFWLLNVIVLVGAVLIDGVPMKDHSPMLQHAEYIGALIYMVMQGYYFNIHFTEYKRMQKAVDEYYDRDRKDLLGWMGRSIRLLAILAPLLPIVIFFQGTLLVFFSIIFFFSIAYCVINLYSYGISEDVTRVEEAEGEEEIIDKGETRSEKSAEVFTPEDEQLVAEAVEQWKESAAYREHNLTLNTVAEQMHVPSRLLHMWLHRSTYGKLATLVTTLRIEEAKRVLKDHPDWNVDSVAEYCGFNGRKYFHQVFQEYTGTTPAKYERE